MSIGNKAQLIKLAGEGASNMAKFNTFMGHLNTGLQVGQLAFDIGRWIMGSGKEQTDKCKELEAKVNSCIKELAEMEKQASGLRSLIDDLYKKIENLKFENKQKDKMLEEQTKKHEQVLAEMNKKMNDMDARHKAQIEIFQKAIDQQAAQILYLNQALNDEKEKNQQERITETQNFQKRLDDQGKVFEANFKRLTERCDATMAENLQLKTDLKAAHSEIDRLTRFIIENNITENQNRQQEVNDSLCYSQVYSSSSKYTYKSVVGDMKNRREPDLAYQTYLDILISQGSLSEQEARYLINTFSSKSSPIKHIMLSIMKIIVEKGFKIPAKLVMNSSDTLDLELLKNSPENTKLLKSSNEDGEENLEFLFVAKSAEGRSKKWKCTSIKFAPENSISSFRM